MASAQDINIYAKEFPAFYHKEVLPILSSFEQERLTKKAQVTAIGWSCLVVIIVCVVLYFALKTSCPSILLYDVIGGCAILFGLFIWMSRIGKGFQRKVKAAALEKLLSFFGDFSWGLEAKINKAEVEKSKLFHYFEHYKTDDNFEGSFKGQKVVISEVELTKTVRETNIGSNSRDNTKIVKVFKGALVKISLNKKFQSQTVITNGNAFLEELVDGDNTLVNSLISTVATGTLTIRDSGGGIKDFYKRNKMEPVELEDVEFNKMFDVYTNNQVEARYLITTSFMERYKLLAKALKPGAEGAEIINKILTLDIRASFSDNSVIITIPRVKDMFVLGDLNKPMNDPAPIQEFFNDFIAALSLVDSLKLDAKTGL